MVETRDRCALWFGACCIGLGLATAAWPHGAARWIQEGPYYRIISNEPTVHCCGPNDCEMWPEKDVEVRPDGYHLKSTGEVIPFGKTQYTEADQVQRSRYWRCHNSRLNDQARAAKRSPSWNWQPSRHDSTNYGTACFFVPGGAS